MNIDYVKMAVGRQLKIARETSGFTQEQIGEISGDSFQSVGNWEKGKSLPVSSKLPAICKKLSITPNDLFKDFFRDENGIDASQEISRYNSPECGDLIDLLVRLDATSSIPSNVTTAIKVILESGFSDQRKFNDQGKGLSKIEYDE